MKEQNYKNHRQLVPLYHIVLLGLLVLALFASVYNVRWHYVHTGGCGLTNWIEPVILFGLSIAAIMQFFFSRLFAAKVQDRAIRSEENLRHFVMTGKPFDSKLTMPQIIALRFASDAEFLALAKRAVDENLTNKQIKEAIKDWRADHHRA